MTCIIGPNVKIWKWIEIIFGKNFWIPNSVSAQYDLKRRQTLDRQNRERRVFVFWDMTLCSSLNINRRFGEHVSILRIATLPPTFTLVCLFLQPWRWKSNVSTEHLLTLYIPKDRAVHNHRPQVLRKEDSVLLFEFGASPERNLGC
jgi:hypothetical protein